jgi:pimeloyl-ACP methyl ester carboxylesterase
VSPGQSPPGEAVAEAQLGGDGAISVCRLETDAGIAAFGIRGTGARGTIAEEYALLDCISGGRLIAGFPVGLSYDANLNAALPAVETRERYREHREFGSRIAGSQVEVIDDCGHALQTDQPERTWATVSKFLDS